MEGKQQIWRPADKDHEGKLMSKIETQATSIHRDDHGRVKYWAGSVGLPLQNTKPSEVSKEDLAKSVSTFLTKDRDLLKFYQVTNPARFQSDPPSLMNRIEGGLVYIVRFSSQSCPFQKDEILILGGSLVVSGLIAQDEKTGEAQATVESISGIYYSCPSPTDKLFDAFRKKDKVLLAGEMQKKILSKYAQEKGPPPKEQQPLGFSLMDTQGTLRLVYGMKIGSETYFERL